MWLSVVSYLNNIFVTYIKDHLALIIMSSLGLSGGIYLFIVKFELGRAWTKVVLPELKKDAAKQDEKKVEDANLKKYEDAVKSGDLNEIAKSGSDLLNG